MSPSRHSPLPARRPSSAVHAVACLLLASALGACSEFSTPAAPELTSSLGRTPASFAVTSDLGAGTITSDGGGVYVNGGGVVSIIQGTLGAWELDQQTTRRTSLTLGTPTTTYNADLAAGMNPGVQLVHGRFLSNPGAGWRYDTMSPGDVKVASLSFAFTANGRQYALRMNTANRAGSDSVSVRCATGTSGRCASWEITPRDGVSTTAHLEESLRKGFANIGLYEVSFSITLTRP